MSALGRLWTIGWGGHGGPLGTIEAMGKPKVLFVVVAGALLVLGVLALIGSLVR